MRKKNEHEWYKPLEPHFKKRMPIERFAKTEAMLHLLSVNAPTVRERPGRRPSKGLFAVCPVSRNRNFPMHGGGEPTGARTAFFRILSLQEILAG